MAKANLNYQALNDIASEFLDMNAELKAQIRGTAQEIGNQLKANTEMAIPRGAIAKHGIHLADEVKMSVSVGDKRASITVKGGKRTGGYWFIVDNGHIAKNGDFVGGAHFTDKAYQATNVSGPVDVLISNLVKNK